HGPHVHGALLGLFRWPTRCASCAPRSGCCVRPGLTALTPVAEFERNACPPSGERIVIGDVLSSYYELCPSGFALALHRIRDRGIFIRYHRCLESGHAIGSLVCRVLVLALDFLADRSRDAAHDGMHLLCNPKPTAASSWSKADCELGRISVRQFRIEPALRCAGPR